MEANKHKWKLIFSMIAFVLALALLGGQWSTSQAARTVPTIPIENPCAPNLVRVGSGDFELTITGSGFDGVPGVNLHWSFPNVGEFDLAPFYVSPDGTRLKVTIPAALTAKAGKASVWISSNPGLLSTDEAEGPYTIDILYASFLPIVGR